MKNWGVCNGSVIMTMHKANASVPYHAYCLFYQLFFVICHISLLINHFAMLIFCNAHILQLKLPSKSACWTLYCGFLSTHLNRRTWFLVSLNFQNLAHERRKKSILFSDTWATKDIANLSCLWMKQVLDFWQARIVKVSLMVKDWSMPLRMANLFIALFFIKRYQFNLIAWNPIIHDDSLHKSSPSTCQTKSLINAFTRVLVGIQYFKIWLVWYLNHATR